MTKRFSFEIKITGILLVILTLVTLTGIFAYQRFSGIVNQISENLRPDMRLLTAKALINNINDAEISVKSFRITEDTIYLDQFYESVHDAEYKLNELHEYSETQPDPERHLDLDTLDQLISNKVQILNSLLLLQDGFRTQQALDKVVKKFEENTNELDSSETIENRKKIFSWLNKKKNQPDSTRSDTIIPLDKLSNQVNEIKSEELKFQKEFKQKELDFIIQDQYITKKIMAFFDEFEAAELEQMAFQSSEAEKSIKRTNQQIALFCAITGALVLFMAFIIINYVRTNNRYRKALRRSKNEAQRLAKTKQKFLANMSHEIRTPMNAIAGFSEQIGKGPLTTEQREQLDMVLKSTDHLLYLINEVLDLSKLQANKLELEHIAFDPTQILKDMAKFLGNETNTKGIESALHFKSELPQVFIGDPYRLQQILFNIIGNAVKFTDKGSIQIHAKAEVIDPQNCILSIEIRDSGIGIEKKNLNTIFNEFEQADSSTTRNFGGTGLGLSIVKLLVERHNGNINIESTPNVGTSILIDLPYEIGNVENINEILHPEKSVDLQLEGLNVLIVDDEKYNRLLLISILKSHNVICTEATNGEEALEELNENDFDLILMDVRMPVLNGVDTAKVIRKLKNERKKNTPIIALTAAVTEDDKLKYKNAGMNGFLSKPFKENELFQVILNCIPSLAKNEQESTKNKKNNEMDAAIDFSNLKNLSAGDQDFYKEMLETFIEGTTEGIAAINEHLLTNNWEMIAEYAHKISSPCNHMGAKKLYQFLKDIENNCRNQENIEATITLIKNANNESETVLLIVREELSQIH